MYEVTSDIPYTFYFYFTILKICLNNYKSQTKNYRILHHQCPFHKINLNLCEKCNDKFEGGKYGFYLNTLLTEDQRKI